MSNRFNRTPQHFNPNPKFRPTAPSASSSLPITKPTTSSNPNPSTSSRRNRNKNKNNNHNNHNQKKKVTSVWVKKPERRNWLELPRDVMLHIFLKLGVMELLYNAQSVCSSWREIARDPMLYRRVDLSNPWVYFNECEFDPIVNMAIEAINRSCGQMNDFSIMYFGTNEMLRRALDTSCRLKRLHLATCYNVSDDALVEVVEKMPMLETVELCLCSFSTKAIEAVGRACPGLKSFRLNYRGCVFAPGEVTDDFSEEALAIANTMPGLTSLHLFGNSMTNSGLKAILDKCPHLEYLDLRQCFNLDLKGDMLKKCREIKSLRLPHDSTVGYEFDATIDHDDFGSDYSYDGDVASYFSYDDFTDPFHPMHWCDDEDYKFIMGQDSDDDFGLGSALFSKAFLADDDSDFGF